MKLTYRGTIRELSASYFGDGGDEGPVMMIGTDGLQQVFRVPIEQLRTLPLFGDVTITIETLEFNPRPAPAPRPDEQDAKRYRYLRASPHFNRNKCRLEWYLPRWYSGDGTAASRLDQTIDAEINQQDQG